MKEKKESKTRVWPYIAGGAISIAALIGGGAMYLDRVAIKAPYTDNNTKSRMR